MLKNSFNLENTLKIVAPKADWWGVREYREDTQTRISRNGKSHKNSTTFDHGVMTEVMINGFQGYAATNDLTVDGLKRSFEKAAEMARTCGQLGLYPFNEKIRPSTQGSYTSPVQIPIESLSAADIQNHLIKMSSRLKNGANVIESAAMAMVTRTEIKYLSSNGSNWVQDFSMITTDQTATGRKNDVVQQRSGGLLGNQQGAEVFSNPDVSERILKELNELLDAKDCPNEIMDLIIEPDQLYLQVHESIGHPLELDRILGDERNYAGWSFLSKEDFGKLRYGPDILNVTFNPNVKGAMASYDFDDNGVPAKREFLIEKGILKRALGGIESQTRSQVPGVSCARSSSWNRPPIDRMANVNIEPGASTMQDMIESTEYGVIMKTNKSWSIDDYRNKFQFGCEYGQMIRNGNLAEVVRNPNYRGITIPFWNNLTHVGNLDTYKVYGSPYCGKGEPNQIIRVAHAIPTCKFKNIEVFGGA